VLPPGSEDNRFAASLPSNRRDEALSGHIQQIWKGNFPVYGARKVWWQFLREGVMVARYTVERLMRRLGLQGVDDGQR
jgi:transposase InsO family protein